MEVEEEQRKGGSDSGIGALFPSRCLMRLFSVPLYDSLPPQPRYKIPLMAISIQSYVCIHTTGYLNFHGLAHGCLPPPRGQALELQDAASDIPTVAACMTTPYIVTDIGHYTLAYSSKTADDTDDLLHPPPRAEGRATGYLSFFVSSTAAASSTMT